LCYNDFDNKSQTRKEAQMKNKIKLIILTAIISIGLGLGTNAAVKNAQPQIKTPAQIQKIAPAGNIDTNAYVPTSSLDIVANPAKYLNKKVKIHAQFDKFSTLGLDYMPAFRSSEKYITFLIKRDDVKDHTIPLAEMKNFLLRDDAEKYIDLKPGDVIEYYGTVFSDALGDAWVNVDKFTVLSQQSKTNPTKK
jgi:hypothetical protein